MQKIERRVYSTKTYRFDRIYWHQTDAKNGRRSGCGNSLHADGHILSLFQVVEQSQDTRVGRRVPETRQWTLHERR